MEQLLIIIQQIYKLLSILNDSGLGKRGTVSGVPTFPF